MLLNVNNKSYNVDVESDMPLLWVLRDIIELTGTKYGCGIGICGSCVVLIDGEPNRSCILPVADAVGKNITTIEGLSDDNSHPLQIAWMDRNVTQCGYCQPGQIMSAAALLQKVPKPTDQQIQDALHDNICRCGTYQRIIEAVQLASKG
jgi:isoquinoline 1-oxidoreductase subunit alpha